MEQIPGALTSLLSVIKKTHASVSDEFNKVKIPLLSQAKLSVSMPVLREITALSVFVIGIVVSLQQAEHPMGMQGRFLPMFYHGVSS